MLLTNNLWCTQNTVQIIIMPLDYLLAVSTKLNPW